MSGGIDANPGSHLQEAGLCGHCLGRSRGQAGITVDVDLDGTTKGGNIRINNPGNRCLALASKSREKEYSNEKRVENVTHHYA